MEGNSDREPIRKAKQKSLETVSLSVILHFERRGEREREMEAAMGLMRRIPPKHTETALSALLSLMPRHSSDLLSQVDQPLQVDFFAFALVLLWLVLPSLAAQKLGKKMGLKAILFFFFGLQLGGDFINLKIGIRVGENSLIQKWV